MKLCCFAESFILVRQMPQVGWHRMVGNFAWRLLVATPACNHVISKHNNITGVHAGVRWCKVHACPRLASLTWMHAACCTRCMTVHACSYTPTTCRYISRLLCHSRTLYRWNFRPYRGLWKDKFSLSACMLMTNSENRVAKLCEVSWQLAIGKTCFWDPI